MIKQEGAFKSINVGFEGLIGMRSLIAQEQRD